MIHSETLQPSHATLRLVAELDEFKGSWSALSRLALELLEALLSNVSIGTVRSPTPLRQEAGGEWTCDSTVTDPFPSR